MTRSRPPLFWLLLLAAVVIGLWWLFSAPYEPRVLFRAMPANALYVSEHRRLVDRGDAFARNPVTLSLFSSMGIRPSELKSLTADPETERWFRRLAARHVVLAYVPELGGGGEPAWVFSSWLGGRSQRLRFWLSWSRVPGYRLVELWRGRRYWEVEAPFLRSDLRLCVAFVEGAMVGCLTGDPHVMRDVLDAHDGLRPSIVRRADFSRAAWCADASARDRGWVDLSAFSAMPPDAGTALFEFSELTPTSLAGQVCGRAPGSAGHAGHQAVSARGMGAFLGDAPLAVVLARGAAVVPILRSRRSPGWLRLLGELAEDEKADAVVLAVLGGAYGGRFHGVRVPALAFAMPVRDSARVRTWALDALDRLNTRYRWGLIPRRLESAGGEITVLEGTLKGVFGDLTPGEQPAYAIPEGWFILSSNSDSLTRLMERPRSAADSAQPTWSRSAEESSSAAYVWMDLAQGGKAMRLAISACSLKLLLSDPQASQDARQRLNEAKAWMDSLAPLEALRLWARSDGDFIQARFRIGP
jgi:hypothetical protein